MSDIGAETTAILAGSDTGDDEAKPKGVMRSLERDGQPDSDEAALVKETMSKITEWKKHHEKALERMQEDVKFASNKHGAQWDGKEAAPDKRYVANITFRHIQGRTGVLYAKNPRVKMARRKRIDYKLWDGTREMLQMAQDAMKAAQSAGQPQMVPGPDGQPMMAPPPPMPSPVDIQGARLVLAEADQIRRRRQMLDKVGKTAEILYQYYQDEGNPDFKKRAKAWVRRTLTCGVGWLKLDFERQRDYTTKVAGEINQWQTELDRLMSELDKMGNDKTPEGSARIEEVEAQLKKLRETPMVTVRQGLRFGFPKSWRVIPDMTCSQLSGLVDCWEMAEEMPMTPDEIRETYKVDIGTNYKVYHGKDKNGRDRKEAMVYEHYNRRTGLMSVVCEGFPAFIVKPTAPRVETKRFFPYFPLCFNEMECEDGEIFPPSDVQLIKHQQQEYNRSREALRQHRIASQPGFVASSAAFASEDDARKMAERQPHHVVMLEQLGDKKISDVIQPIPLNPIDPNVYETNMVFQDVMRSVGDQAENFGGGDSHNTATQASIGENSRLSTIQSNVDDLDMVLTEVARDACHIMLMQVDQAEAQRIAGEGAVWPSEITAADYSAEVYLETVAGSSGKPNRDRDAALLERLYPLAVQTGSISPKWLATKVVQLMDETVDLEEAILADMPPILALTEAAKAALTPAAPAAPGGTGLTGGGDTPTGNPETAPAMQGAPGMAPMMGGGGGPPATYPAPDAAPMTP